MTQSRLASSSIRLRRSLLRTVALPVELLEARRLMCSTAGAALDAVLAADTAANVGAAARDHKASWYKAIGTVGTTKAHAAQAVGPVVDTAAARSATSDIVPSGTPVNAAGLPLLTSRADGQGLKVFLDFDGYGTDLPFSTDADTSTFNASEQLNIYDTWRDIVSFFAPLNVNVTTIQPPTGGNNPVFAWQRISNSIQGGAAYVGWLTNDSSNGWTGSDNAVNRHSGIAHEIGHQLGLSHQSEYDVYGNKTDEYSDGYDSRDRPIIGIDFAENVREWYYGRNSDSPLNLQDDLQTMANTIAARIGGDGYRPDDVGNTLAAAATVPASGMTSGIIERIDDADVFKFVAAGGTYQIAATPTFESSTSPKIELLDSTGNIVAARDDADRRNTNNNAQEFSLNLSAGTYYVRVSSSGDNGEQGEYLLTTAPLPSNWTSQDIGATTIYRAGTAAYDPNANTLTQVGGGTDIWSTTDEFRYTSTTLTGDGSITARIDSLDNVDPNAKAGVMIRATTAANSAHVYVGIKPSGQLDPIVRTSGGAVAATVGNPSGLTGPWVRLTRVGNVFTIYNSTDGVTWNTYGTTTVTMGSAVQIGFATNSRSPRQQAYASFSNINVTGALGAAAPSYNALAAPTGLTGTTATGANTSIVLAWNAVAGSIGYLIERSFDGVNFAAWSTVASGVLTYTDANLFGSMRYFYRVAAMGTLSSRSAPSSVVSVVNKPSTPLIPNASYAQPSIRYSSTQVLLNWADVQGDNGYRVERSTAGGAYVTIATTTVNHNAYNDSGLTPNTAYTYRITPLTSIGDGVAGSLIISVLSPTSAPTNFRVTGRTSTSMTFAWDDLTNESGYRLERSTDASTWSLVSTLAANTVIYTDATGLAPLTRYYYRLRAIDTSGGFGDPTVAFAATPSNVALPATWSDADVGSVPGAGAGAGVTGGAWSVIGSGSDIWGTADQFNFLSRGVTGDGSIVARLTSLDSTDYYVKAGVMFRESTAANSPYVFMHYSTGPGLQFEFRDSTGASSGNAFQLTSDARWLRLTRVGNIFTAAYSADGVTWTNAASRTVVMSSVARVGLAATSHNTSRLTLATYDNVTTTGAGVNTAPTITTAAAASPATVTSGMSTTVSVGAADDGGTANLTYLWSTLTKPAGVADATFSVNNTNAASTALATFAAAGQYTLRVAVRDATGATTTSDVAVTVSLRATSGTYLFDAPRPEFDVQLNGNVSASLSASDFVLTNLTTGNVIPSSQIVVSFNATTNVAALRFAVVGNGTLPDGNYSVKLLAGSVQEPSGVALSADASYAFFVKAGDVNRDGKVDFSDLVILAQNYNSSGKTYSSGNLDYDPTGSVDFNDLVILAQNYNTSLPAMQSASVTLVSVGTKGDAKRGTKSVGAGIVS